VLTVLVALTAFLSLLMLRHFKKVTAAGGGGRRRPSPPVSTDLDTVDCDPDMEIIRTPLPEPTFLSNAAQYGVSGGSTTLTESATVRYPTLGRVNRVLRNSHHGGDGSEAGSSGGPLISPTPPRDTVVRYSTIGRHRISPNGGGSYGGSSSHYAGGGLAGGACSAGVMMYTGMSGGGGAVVYAPGSAYSGVSNHSSYLDADLADPRSLTRSQQSDFPFYD
jgi:hypothetical protein